LPCELRHDNYKLFNRNIGAAMPQAIAAPQSQLALRLNCCLVNGT